MKKCIKRKINSEDVIKNINREHNYEYDCRKSYHDGFRDGSIDMLCQIYSLYMTCTDDFESLFMAKCKEEHLI